MCLLLVLFFSIWDKSDIIACSHDDLFRKPNCLFVNNLFSLKYWYTCLWIIFSSILDIAFRRLIGLWFEASFLSPSLKIGLMIDSFNSLGISPVESDRFIIWVSGAASSYETSFITLLGIPSVPLLLFGFNLLQVSLNSFIVTCLNLWCLCSYLCFFAFVC